jgi:hypothetical protein
MPGLNILRLIFTLFENVLHRNFWRYDSYTLATRWLMDSPRLCLCSSLVNSGPISTLQVAEIEEEC